MAIDYRPTDESRMMCNEKGLERWEVLIKYEFDCGLD